MYNIRFKQDSIAMSDCECFLRFTKKSLSDCRTGEIKIKKEHNQKAKWVIDSAVENDVTILADCYRNSLNLLKANNIHSIAFPMISMSLDSCHSRESVVMVLNTIMEWLDHNSDYVMLVEFCCSDEYSYSYYRGIYDTMTKNREQQYEDFVKFIKSNDVHLKDAKETDSNNNNDKF